MTRPGLFAFILAAALIAAGGFAGGMQFRRPVEISGCDPPRIPAPAGKPYADGQSFAGKILGLIGLPNNVEVYMEESPETGWSDPQYRRIYLGTGNGELYKDRKLRWEVARVLAHEIGHVLNQNDLSGREPEEMANEFSGWAAHRLGATLEQAMSGVVNDRAKSPITRGWNRD
jgi:hypothetical protein